MKLIKSKVELFPFEPGIEGIYKTIERAGRCCYKSESKITKDSAKPFVDRMIESKHLAMLEHGTVYLSDISWIGSNLEKYKRNKYSKYNEIHLESETIEDGNDVYTEHKYAHYVTTNLRVLVENGWLDDLRYVCEPTEYHEKRYTFKLTTSIGVTRELNRHRANSIAEQSTRYCNYSKDKFGNQISFVLPVWCDSLPEGEYTYWDSDWTYCKDQEIEHELPNTIIRNAKTDDDINRFLTSCMESELSYMGLINKGWIPQQAREVLPLCTASEICHTAFASDWRFFFDLRLFGKTGKPHPNMLQLAELMEEEAKKNGIWEDIMKYPSKFNGNEKEG